MAAKRKKGPTDTEVMFARLVLSMELLVIEVRGLREDLKTRTPNAQPLRQGYNGDRPPDALLLTNIACPSCNGPLRWRQNRSDKTWFAGCAGYPVCTGTRPMWKLEQMPEFLEAREAAETKRPRPVSGFSTAADRKKTQQKAVEESMGEYHRHAEESVSLDDSPDDAPF